MSLQEFAILEITSRFGCCHVDIEFCPVVCFRPCKIESRFWFRSCAQLPGILSKTHTTFLFFLQPVFCFRPTHTILKKFGIKTNFQFYTALCTFRVHSFVWSFSLMCCLQWCTIPFQNWIQLQNDSLFWIHSESNVLIRMLST